jgi:acyl-CoA synthetase (AMP-forming)/AMP-acid ligase II/acyl carrier protein
MLRLIRYLFWTLFRFVLWLRYRVHVHGLDEVCALEGPLLILPNHPAFIDPLIVLASLTPSLHPRPLLLESNFRGPLSALLVVLDALRVPDLEQTSAEARQRTEETIQSIKDALNKGQNVVLWPAGRLERAAVEDLGAARTVSDVLRDVPLAQVVLVKTRGLWGSRFSWGWDGTKPKFMGVALRGLGHLFANLIFFAPRRNVSITLEPIDRARLPGTDREVLNPWLEKWYNSDAPEKPTFVPLHFLFGPRTREFPKVESAASVDLSKLTDEIRKAVDEIVTTRLKKGLPGDGLTPESSLERLGMDSLDRMELSLQVERRFGFRGDAVPTTMAELYALAAGLVERKPPKPPPAAWFANQRDTRPPALLGEHVAEAFVARALACRSDIACADDSSGALTYERLLVGASTMAKRFREIPGKNVGLLMPASVGCDVALLALFLADKLPVVLNWTTGPANLEHAARLLELSHVVSSKLFIDRIGVQVAGTQYLFLEDLRARIGKVELLWTLVKARFLPGRIRAEIPRVDPASPAVVLFTSGSEKAPKAVPLTHRNIFLNQRAGIEVLKFCRSDSLLGFLPAFHSFGMSITGLFPLLGGVRVVRHPDPTDAAALARKVGVYKPTVLVGTPTFVSYILERAESGELTSLRMIIVGAEKCPETLFARCKEASPSAVVLEGYGITECSPVVSVNPPEAPRPGTVGRALPGVETCVLDLETDTEVPQGEMGMLLVAGPTVFGGYIGPDAPSPFRDHAGKRWYVTGDLVQIDREGYITFSGRLKRFIKAGGEMISLPAMEEPFARLHPPTKDGPRVAVEGVELDGGGRNVVLFTTEPITLREANDLLQKEGFQGVMRLDDVQTVPSLPVLGTGKTDYKVLRAKIVEGSAKT